VDRFARVILGYHGCEASFASELLTWPDAVAEWKGSKNDYDWLGSGIYFWEHAPERALEWATQRGCKEPAVIGAVVQLGRCFDLMNIVSTRLLAQTYRRAKEEADADGRELPKNTSGRDLKARRLDCYVINTCLESSPDPEFQTVRGAFLEGDEVYKGAMIREQSHVQVAVRDPACILGVFRPILRR
jgi:hypothetical protein